MDPLTAWCNMATAYITYATARYNGASDADKATISAVDAAIIKAMYDAAVKLRDDLVALGSHLNLDKVKSLFDHTKPGPVVVVPPAPVAAPK